MAPCIVKCLLDCNRFGKDPTLFRLWHAALLSSNDEKETEILFPGLFLSFVVVGVGVRFVFVVRILLTIHTIHPTCEGHDVESYSYTSSIIFPSLRKWNSNCNSLVQSRTEFRSELTGCTGGRLCVSPPHHTCLFRIRTLGRTHSHHDPECIIDFPY